VTAARFALALLALAPCVVARAESEVTPLLKPLDLAGYPSRTPPPRFSGRTVDAHRVSIEDLRGKVVLVNFWASWCGECRPEMPVLERLHRELGPQGLAIVGVNAREDSTAVQRYARELGLTFPLVLDPDGKIKTMYGVVGLPTTFIVARDGRAVGLAVGPREWAGAPARALFQALLAEPPPGPGAR
jgi:cytochrome c biogenesis protein CcmG, thiol:disulfide interchange protein DsbE